MRFSFALLILVSVAADSKWKARTPENPGTFQKRKTVFLIRHGQSTWNEFQDSISGKIQCFWSGATSNHTPRIKNLVDVTLTEKGKRQAYTTGVMMQKGWKKDDTHKRSSEKFRKEFLETNVVCSSPLRRPVQTASYAVPHVKQMTVLPGLREIRSTMNVDSVGHKKSELHNAYAKCLDLTPEAVSNKFDLSNVKKEQWWTPDKELTGRDKYAWIMWTRYVEPKEKVAQQISETLDWFKDQTADKIIASSHSHKIQNFLNDMQRTDLAANKIETMIRECFKGSSPPNGSVTRLDIIWTEDGPVILDADFVYDPRWDIETITSKPHIAAGLTDNGVSHAPTNSRTPSDDSNTNQGTDGFMILFYVGVAVVISLLIFFLFCRKVEEAELPEELSEAEEEL